MVGRPNVSLASRLNSVAVGVQHPLQRLRSDASQHGFLRICAGSAGTAQAVEAQPPVPSEFARDEEMARVEAVLLLSREPLNSRKVAQLAGVSDGTRARTLVRKLNAFYDKGGTAFRIEEVAGGFQMLSRPKFGTWLRRMFRSPVETQLSAPALETLAVVAYRQPVLRADIEAIRGVQCGEILRQLMERDLVRIDGRAEELGRPFLYATTKRFLQVFGLRHLEELPRADLLRRANPSKMSTAEETKNSVGDDRLENTTGSSVNYEEEISK